MTIWEILGIEATTDQRAIKRAYAKKLKGLDIEKEPVAFQELKEAFDAAQQVGVIDNDEEMEFVAPPPIPTPEEYDQQRFEVDLNQFLTQMTYFADVTGWQQLMGQINLLSLEEYEAARQLILSFFDYHYLILSGGVRDYLIASFGLFQEGQTPYSLQTQTYIKELPAFDYDFLPEIPLELRESYLWRRAHFYEAICYGGDCQTGGYEELRECRQIAPQDPSLNLLECWYLLRQDIRFAEAPRTARLLQLLQGLPESPQKALISEYRETVKRGALAVPDFLKRYPELPAAVPVSVYRLMGGYLGYLLQDQGLTAYYWQDFEERYGYGSLTDEERVFLGETPLATDDTKPVITPVFSPRAKKIGWRVALAAAALICGVTATLLRQVRTRQTVRPPAIQRPILPETSGEQEQDEAVAASFKEAPELERRCFYYLYLMPTDPERQQFIQDNFAPEIQPTVAEPVAEAQLISRASQLNILWEETAEGTYLLVTNTDFLRNGYQMKDFILLIKEERVQGIWGTDLPGYEETAYQELRNKVLGKTAGEASGEAESEE